VPAVNGTGLHAHRLHSRELPHSISLMVPKGRDAQMGAGGSEGRWGDRPSEATHEADGSGSRHEEEMTRMQVFI
jgi:hypothetical protein